MGTVEAPPRPVVDAGPRPGMSSADVLSYPAGTTLRFLLLVFMTLLSSAFVGNWLFLSTADAAEVTPSWWWLAVPPLVCLLLAAALTALAPRWLERRHGWKVVSPVDAPVAVLRYDALVAEAGLHDRPELVWSPLDDRTRALSYGRPGRYRVAISPVLVGAARRRPSAFDAVIRHELAHIRHRDVVPAYFAVIAWYVLVAALSVPLLWRVVSPDFSLVPEYLARVAVLALLVYWVRADLLRTREHYADVRASDTHDRRLALLATWSAPTSVTTGRRFFSLHPSTQSRRLVVTDPSRLGRLEWGEFLAVGLAATWTAPLLTDVLFSTGSTVDVGVQVTRLTVFALVGAYLGASLSRWSGCGGDLRNLAKAATALVVGIALGSTLSLANTGLLVHARADLAASSITALVVGASLFWAADLSLTLESGTVASVGIRARAALSVVTSAGVVALVAAALLTPVELVRLHAAQVLVDEPLYSVASARSAQVLAVAAPLLGLAVLVLAARLRVRPRTRLVPTVAVGAVLGVVATLLALTVRWQVDLAGDPDREWRYFLALVWIAVGCAVVAALVTASGRGAGRMGAGWASAGIAVVVAWAGFVLYEDLGYGSTLPASDVLRFGRDANAVVVLLAAVPLALVWLARGAVARAAVGRVVTAVGGSMLAVALAGGVIAFMPDAVMGETPSGPVGPVQVTLSEYLEEGVPAIMAQRDAAYAELQSAMTEPGAALAATRIREAVVPRYDEVLAAVDRQRAAPGRATEVRNALRTLLAKERTLVLTQADVLDGRLPVSAYVEATGEVDQAMFAWLSTHREALGK